MSSREKSSLTDENQDLRKQIGCMNGIFQMFDRRQFIAGRRSTSHSNKRLLQDARRQQDDHCTKVVMEKAVEMRKEKPRISTESSRASCSSSSCSTSTFSSFDCNRIAQPETLPSKHINISESRFQIISTKGQQPSLHKSMHSLDIRDAVKNSMYREVHSSSSAKERRENTMKHIDSPRPSLLSKPGRQKGTGYDGSARIVAKVQEGKKDERQLALHRFSYDGRESGETVKWNMKHKELPRLSLDSKTSSTKSSAVKSRLDFLGRNQHESSSQDLSSNQEPGSHQRTSSLVAKLMGLETFPDAISSCESWSSPTLKSSNSLSNTPRSHVSQSNPASPSPRLCGANSVRKPTACSRFPMEPAPWRKQNCSQSSPQLDSRNKKASVYGEIGKRIKELEFKKSGKDLRALKQILEAMDKTGEHSAEIKMQSRISSEDSCSSQSSNLPKSPVGIKGNSSPRQLGSSVANLNPTTMTDKVYLSSLSQVPSPRSKMSQLRSKEPKYHRENSSHRQRPPRNSNVKDPSPHLSSTYKSATWRASKLNRTSPGPRHIVAENYTTPGRSSRMVSPRSQQNLLRVRLSQSTTQLLDSKENKQDSVKKITEKGSPNRKHKVNAKDMRLRDVQSREHSSETGYSSYLGDMASVKSEGNSSIVSQTETENILLANSTNLDDGLNENASPTARKHIRGRATETVVAMVEQPSPISVLDDTFYSEDSPSPVRKTSNVFEDEASSLGETEWNLDDGKYLTECRRSVSGFEYNQTLGSMNHSIKEFKAADVYHNALVSGSHNPDEKYIKNILLTSGLFKDSSFITATNQLLQSCHLLNPDTFHVIEQTEDVMEGLNGEVIDRKDEMKLEKKIQRKIIFDMVDEILVRKIKSGRFTVGKKRTNAQGLLKEIQLEMDRMWRISNGYLDNIEDEMIRLLTEDTMYQSEDWQEYNGELPVLVLDIERQIFKELINEVVTGEVMTHHDKPKSYCRQLF